MSVNLGIEDFGDLVLGLTVNFDWWRWRMYPLWNGVQD
jgi:hypothetical protein